MFNKSWFSGIMLLVLLLALPITAGAQDELELTVVTDQSCDQVSFTLSITGGMGPYDVKLKYGDSEVFEVKGTKDTVFNLDHAYPAHGTYTFSAEVSDADDLEYELEGEIMIDGPEVKLGSTPSPPLLTIDGGLASIKFDVEVTGGVEPYTYLWDLDQDGLSDAGLDGSTASYSYTAYGEYTADVTVTDACGLADSATLTVVVDDPEDDPEEACHPTAQKIAEAVSSLFPEGRAEQVYTCADIFNIFEGALTGSQLGFGRLWKAYQLTQTIDDLTWEEIRDWKLEYSSWGALSQLNRMTEFLDEYGIRELYDLVASEEYTLRDIRTAARSVLRDEADFEDALARIAEGANAGELGQFYRLVNELEVDPEELDVYLTDGMSLSELRHATKLAERTDADWTEILDAKALDASWGEIGQAYKLADDETSVEEILSLGVNEYRKMQREEERAQREEERNTRAAEREEERVQGTNNRDLRTAGQLASKYGISVDDVMNQLALCNQDWNCVRTQLREQFKNTPGKDKKK